MPLRAIDFHVHLPTPDWLDGSMAGYVEAAEAYFRSPVARQSLGELAALYRGLEVTAVLLAWDAETATGRPRVPNETVAAACRDYPDVFTGLGSVDPHKGEAAVAEVENIAAHPGWPWIDEMTAVALHKGNVYWELSGWAPKYFPPSLRTDIRGRLREKMMFGSDHPSLPYERILREWDELGYDQSVLDLVFHANAERVLGL